LKKKGEITLKEALGNMIQHNKLGVKLTESKLIEEWPTLMGNTINSYTNKIELRNQKLYLSIDSAPLKHEMLTSKTKVIDIINKRFGANTVVDLIIF